MGQGTWGRTENSRRAVGQALLPSRDHTVTARWLGDSTRDHGICRSTKEWRPSFWGKARPIHSFYPTHGQGRHTVADTLPPTGLPVLLASRLRGDSLDWPVACFCPLHWLRDAILGVLCPQGTGKHLEKEHQARRAVLTTKDFPYPHQGLSTLTEPAGGAGGGRDHFGKRDQGGSKSTLGQTTVSDGDREWGTMSPRHTLTGVRNKTGWAVPPKPACRLSIESHAFLCVWLQSPSPYPSWPGRANGKALCLLIQLFPAQIKCSVFD